MTVTNKVLLSLSAKEGFPSQEQLERSRLGRLLACMRRRSKTFFWKIPLFAELYNFAIC
jgi:hypothetical protein